MNKYKNQIFNTRYVVMLGLMLALVLVLSIFEAMIPPLPMLPPGVKLGLANIGIMYVLFFIGKKSALTLAFMKSGFVLITRGAIASVLSLCGGLMSILMMILIMVASKYSSYLLLSIIGAVFHNFGQIIAISLFTKSIFTLYYFPVLIMSGIVMGCITGTLLRVILPYMKHIGRFIEEY